MNQALKGLTSLKWNPESKIDSLSEKLTPSPLFPYESTCFIPLKDF